MTLEEAGELAVGRNVEPPRAVLWPAGVVLGFPEVDEAAEGVARAAWAEAHSIQTKLREELLHATTSD